jgi:LmbE family N-acetylglucosaminyl deacetylase
MEKIGLKEDDIKFLGYPDSGTLSILLEYWGNIEPYINPITKASRVPYPECYSAGAEYVGENILKDLENIIKEFQPTKIFVSIPFDLNNDQRALYLFLRVSLWDLQGKFKNPEVFTYLVHAGDWPVPRGYYPEKSLNPPKQIFCNGIEWSSIYLNDDEIKKKYESIQCNKSQMRFGPQYLFAFDRRNELFANIYDLNLEDKSQSQIVWLDATAGELSYALNNGILFIKITPKQKIDKKNCSISIYLLGYSYKTGFSKMPKIHLKTDGSKLEVFDKNQRLNFHEAGLEYAGNSLIISVPLIFLENPKYILSGIETKAAYLLDGVFGWRVINIK